MSSYGRYSRRRRRGDEEEGDAGGLPVVPLMILVIFAGLLVGGLLAHFFGGRRAFIASPSPPAVTPVAFIAPTAASVTPSPRRTLPPTPQRLATPRSSPAPTLSPSPSSTASSLAVRASPASRVVAVVTATPAQTPLRTPTPSPLPSPIRTSIAVVTQAPVSHVVALQGPTTPDGVVRAYLSALARGRRAAAASYLASGTPTEAFMKGAHIADVQSVDNGDGTYNVSADVVTSHGRYRVIAIVAALPYGMLITDHFSIRPP